jgi:hypothetical protein
MHAIGCVGGTCDCQCVLLQLQSAFKLVVVQIRVVPELVDLDEPPLLWIQRCDASPLVVVRRSPTPVHDDRTDRLAAEQRAPPGCVSLAEAWRPPGGFSCTLMQLRNLRERSQLPGVEAQLSSQSSRACSISESNGHSKGIDSDSCTGADARAEAREQASKDRREEGAMHLRTRWPCNRASFARFTLVDFKLSIDCRLCMRPLHAKP